MQDDRTGDPCVTTGRDAASVTIDQSENTSVTIDQCPVTIDQCGGTAGGGDGEAPQEVGALGDGPAADPADGSAPERRERAKETRARRSKGSGGLQREKSGIWTLRCLVNGKRISKSTGTRDLVAAEQFAKRFLAPYVKDDPARTYANIQAAVMTERQLAEMKEEEGPQLTLADAWDAYVASPMRRDLAETTLVAKRQVIRVFVEYMAKMFPEVSEMRHMTRIHAEHYLNYLRADHSASTYNNRLCVLREVFRVLKDRSRAKANPWDGFPLRADDSHTRRELTVEELARLVDCASREGSEWRTLFGIGMYTGMRLGDCCKLHWSEVDIVKSIIQRIPDKTKKYRKGRPITVPIHRTLADLLMQTPLDERRGYVLPTIGPWAAAGQNGMSKVHSRLGKIFRTAGIVTSVEVEGRRWKVPEAGFHSLRHTFVSMSANAGVPLHIVQSIVGHESSAMTRHYYHENIAALQQAVEAIPSISETGAVSVGEVAQPDIRRMLPPGVAHMTQPLAVPRPALAAPPPPAAAAVQPAMVVGADGVARANPGAEAPLEGRSAERNAVRRENKLEMVEAANAEAATMGGWGLESQEPVSALPTVNRRQRTEWIGGCIRRWCKRRRVSLLEGTTKLIGNGGYRLLQDLWDKGVPILPDDAIEALDVFLKAKEG